MSEANQENFDAMEPDDLMAFWLKTNRVRPITEARQYFPDRPTGYVRIFKDLGNYASNKATAMRERSKGHIQAAEIYERICDDIYKRLPVYARW